MRQELLAARGLLAEHKKRYRDLDMEASGLVVLIRSIVSPYEADISEIRIDEAAASIKRLREIIHEMRALRENIKTLEADLG